MNFKSISNDDKFRATPNEGSDLIDRHQLEENTINSLKAYYALNCQFKALGRSELTERMLRRIAKCDYIPKDFQARPLYTNLSGIIDELMLNELEIALWAIYLENLVWKNLDTYTEQLHLFTAYKAKQYFNGNNIEPCRVYLNAKIKNFEENFKSWLTKYENGFQVNLKMINEKLNTLKILKDAESDYCFINYNYYVDLILLTAAPYADRNDPTTISKHIEETKIEELQDKNSFNQNPLKRKRKKIQSGNKKMKIQFGEQLINNMDLNEKDPDIAKIEKFCDGLMDNDDLNLEEYITKF